MSLINIFFWIMLALVALVGWLLTNDYNKEEAHVVREDRIAAHVQYMQYVYEQQRQTIIARREQKGE